MTLSLPQFLASNFQAISHLTTSTSSTALSLASQSHQTTQEIHQARALISDSAYHLSDVLNTLAGRTTDHIESLDVKVEELKDKLLPPAPKEEDQAWFSYDNIISERWWKGNLVWVLGFLIRGASLSAWIDSPFLKILEIIWIVAFWLLKRSLSTVTSFLVLCFSCRKYLHRILITSTSNWVPNDPERLTGQKQRQFLLSNDLFDPSSRKIAAPAMTGAIGIDPQTNKVLGLSAALEPSVRQCDPRVPQTRIITSRIRLLGTSASSAAATRSRVSRIPDRLCIPSLA
ncbi:uncharacterized protein C8R40DRAFT_888131 [Lentinula edodes]|uniref:uncharacterized protein n=1 Tax=Lentinula edodes TaxID=5353 RepID=UPI001E8EB6C7|nr:uncharacterized protein C8R40DRAFT_888131 [Lentinula edodes]KAH7867961.1 hypothetical protein C8R40DRAFT_888131 [Lentinula edodes]